MTWREELKKHDQEHIDELVELVSMPSVSTAPEHKDDVRRTAEWVAARLRKAGVPEVKIAESPGHPAVLARWHVSDDQPTLMIYGHFDVQPAEPLELWDTPPFDPAIDGDTIVGRGAADMKGNLLTAIYGVEAIAHANGGQPPINIVYFFEGEEEIGSPSMVHIIRENKDFLQADAVLSADGGQAGKNKPSMPVALKGLASVQVNITTTNTDMHSGMYGAYMPNAVQCMAQLAASFHDTNGHVLVDGFYDRVVDLTDDDRAEMANVPIDVDAEMKELGVNALFGPKEFTPRERQWARPTLDMNGIWGGFQGAGVKTVTPAKAHLKITCRLVPDQDPKEIQRLIAAHCEKHCPPGATVEVVMGEGGARPYAVDRDTPFYTAVMETLTELFDTEPMIVRVGGTVPATGIFQDELGLETYTMGWGLPGSKVHAPNECYTLEGFLKGREGFALLLEKLAR